MENEWNNFFFDSQPAESALRTMIFILRLPYLVHEYVTILVSRDDLSFISNEITKNTLQQLG